MVNVVGSGACAVAVVYAMRLARAFMPSRWHRLTDAHRATLAVVLAVFGGAGVHAMDHPGASAWSWWHVAVDAGVQWMIQQVLHDLTHYRRALGPLR